MAIAANGAGTATPGRQASGFDGGVGCITRTSRREIPRRNSVGRWVSTVKLFIVLVLTGCMGLAVELIGLGFAAYVQLASGSGLTASLLDEPMLWLSLIILLAGLWARHIDGDR
jgi:hypothetical protein